MPSGLASLCPRPDVAGLCCLRSSHDAAIGSEVCVESPSLAILGTTAWRGRDGKSYSSSSVSKLGSIHALITWPGFSSTEAGSNFSRDSRNAENVELSTVSVSSS